VKVFVPAGVQEIPEKKKWFKKPICEKLWQEGIEFGFQIQGFPQGLKTLYPYGLHLPANMASQWRDVTKRKKLQRRLKEINNLSPGPLFAVLHGIRVSHSRLGYKEAVSERERNFISDVRADDYFRAIEELIEIIRYCMRLRIPIALENVAFTNFVVKDEITQPKTYLDLRIGTLSSDMLRIKRETGCELLVDIEHLAFALNFAHRKYQYSNLSQEIPDEVSRIETALIKEYGIFLRKYWVPVITKETDFRKEVKEIGAKIYHLCGCYQGKMVEIDDGRVVDQTPILVKDKCFRQYLRIILREKPEILVLETSRVKDNPYWAYLAPNVQEMSFENLCQILLEEI
jgi:hypothetical protein